MRLGAQVRSTQLLTTGARCEPFPCWRHGWATIVLCSRVGPGSQDEVTFPWHQDDLASYSPSSVATSQKWVPLSTSFIHAFGGDKACGDDPQCTQGPTPQGLRGESRPWTPGPVKHVHKPFPPWSQQITRRIQLARLKHSHEYA